MPRELTAVVLALVAALFVAVGIVVRQRSTAHVPAEDGMGQAMAAALVRQPMWWAGTASAVGGFVFQALALSRGSLLLVQPVLVSALLFALPLSARLAHRRVTRSEWSWAVLLTAAIAVFVVVGNPRPGHQRPTGTAWVVVSVLSVLVVAGCVLRARRAVGRDRAVLLAVPTAVAFGLVAVLTTVSVHRLGQGGVTELLTSPAPYALVVAAALGTVLQQSAFHAGALQTSVPTMIVLEPLVAVGLGLAVLGEALDVDGVAVAVLGLAVAVMLAATVALAREAAGHDTAGHDTAPAPTPA